MLTFHLKTPDLEPLFSRLRTPLRDFSLLWPRFQATLQNAAREQIQSGGARGPQGAFPPLAEAYAKRKARRFPGAGILQATGALRDSFLGGRGFHSKLEPLHMEFGSALAYAVYHQTGFRTRLGTRRGNRKSKIENRESVVPARRIFDLSAQDLDALRGAAASWAAEICQRLGFDVATFLPGGSPI